MHLPGPVLDNITCAVTTAASAGAIGYSVYRLRRAAGAEIVPKTAAVAVLIFAAQMVNYPIGHEFSGHLVGGLLAAALLGPWAGLLAMSLVLASQCLLAGDGATATLGANVLNMGVVTVWLGYFVFISLRQAIRTEALSGGMAVGISAAVAAFVTIVAASALCAMELALAGSVPLGTALAKVVAGNLPIGVVEALVTGTAVGLIAARRPDLVDSEVRSQRRGSFSPAASVACLLAAFTVAMCLAPWASSQPDGLERALAALVPERIVLATASVAPLADYKMPGVTNPVLSTALAGAAGALAVYAMVWFAGYGLRLQAVRD